jgi:hypothetical protein
VPTPQFIFNLSTRFLGQLLNLDLLSKFIAAGEIGSHGIEPKLQQFAPHGYILISLVDSRTDSDVYYILGKYDSRSRVLSV